VGYSFKTKPMNAKEWFKDRKHWDVITLMEGYHNAKSWEECKWKYDEHDDKYDTSCGRAFCFMVDTPKENEYYYCPGCGKRIKEDNQ